MQRLLWRLMRWVAPFRIAIRPPIAEYDRIVDAIDGALKGSSRGKHATAALVLELDNYRNLESRISRQDIGSIAHVVVDRLADILRQQDIVVQLDPGRFAIALSPMRRLDLEAAIKLSTRIQQVISNPIPQTSGPIDLTVSIGFALASRMDDPSAVRVLQAACIAQTEASRSGPCAVRSYSAAMEERIAARNHLRREASQAIENGEIRAFFQPQVCLNSNKISGFEALARWQHHSRGLIPPSEFLPILEQAGLMRDLGFTMLRDALRALRDWDQQGLAVPNVSINMSRTELRNPNLIDAVKMELDHFELSPNRLVIEVLETVVASKSDDILINNLAALAKLGCSVDLDDFGTGNASITSVRRFAINRIKIDRSFITKIDCDEEQQQMVAAILTMAERLSLETLAEGVETVEELDHLARTGCGHAQGFIVSRPMPAAEAASWVKRRLFGDIQRPIHCVQ